MPRLFLIDGMSLVFRAYHAMIKSGLKNSEGEPTFALFGFVNIITSLIEKEKPEYIAVAFDLDDPTFRHEQFEDYKANRDEFPEDLVPQLKRIKKFLDLINIHRIEKPGFEADDIIGTMSKRSSKEGWKVFCVTNDKDFYQLVDDNIRIYKPGIKGEDFDIIDYDGVAKKFGVKPNQVIDVQALLGDKVDNVPGVKGVGEKTAIPLIQKYGDIFNLYDNIEEVDKPAVKKKLINGKEDAVLSRKLVTIDTEMDIEYKEDDLKYDKPKFLELDDFFAEVGFNTLRKKWRYKGIESGIKYSNIEDEEDKSDVRVQAEKVTDASKYKTIEDVETDYKLLTNIDEIKKVVDEVKQAGILSFDLETDAIDKNTTKIVGFALSFKENSGYYIPVYYDESPSSGFDSDTLFSQQNEKIKKWDSSLPIYEVIDLIKPILEDVKIDKCGQNIKFDAYIMLRHGVTIEPITFDSMVAAYVLNPDDKQNLTVLSEKWLNYTPVEISSLIGEKKAKQKQGSMADIDPKEIANYAAEDADLALKLMNKIKPELEKDDKLNKLANEIEFPVISVLADMEHNGVKIDTDALSEISEKITKQAADYEQMIYDQADEKFNIDSPKQLSEILFEKMNIPPVKKTKTGYSTDVQVLTQLSKNHPIAEYILEYRSLVKLKSTYVDSLPRLINKETGRIHTTFNQTVASTGRLSSTDPNLQNIPIRTDMGKEIRRAFVAGDKDRVIFSADYSQVELRIMAYICNDEHMVEGFKQNLDIHAATAAVLNDISLEEVTQDMRRIAKTVNFGIMYGLGAYGMTQRIDIGRKEAQEIINNYFDKYPGIKKYMDMTKAEAHENGYAETLCGRRRYFKDINSANKMLQNQAERGAINMPIQGTASDMMKIAMINIHKDMAKNKMRSKMTIQVHDELIFDAHKDELEDLKNLVVHNMENALSLGEVPVKVDTGTGDNWFEAH